MSSAGGAVRTYDVIVVGSGAAGLTTAVVAALRGLSVLVVEKTSFIGGTTAYSGGGAWIPCNPHMEAAGQSDDIGAARDYLRHILGNHYEMPKVEAFLESGPEMVRYLEANSDVRFYPVLLSDYQPTAPGARLARTIIATEFDGRVLGKWLRKVRNPLLGFSAFGTLQTDPQHIGKFKSVFRSVEGFRFSAGRMAAFAWDMLRHGKGAHMANGNALVGRLLHSALGLGVEIWTNAPAEALLRKDEKVTGVAVAKDGKPIRIAAKRGVVLATGGFGGSAELRAKYMPMPEVHLSAQPVTNVGDGIALGESAGGALAEPNPDNGIWAPVSAIRDAKGEVQSVYPHFGPDRGKPGSLIVGPDGTRFADEASPYQDFVNVMHERRIGTAWFIGDRAFLRSYGMGIALPAPLPFRKFVRNGYLVEGRSLDELASRIGVPAAALAATVTRFNAHAARGEDPDFNRGGNIYDNAQGDFDHQPNPNLRPLGPGPYYALALHPGDASSILGLKTTSDAQVQDANGIVVGGLYAVGLDQNSVMHGFYPGGGSSIGPGMTFGYRAALHLARASLHSE